MSSTDILESIKKGKDKVIQAYEMLPTFCPTNGLYSYSISNHLQFDEKSFIFLDTPDLLEELRSTMKEYVILEAHWKDLKVAKQKVNQHTMTLINETYDPTVDDIHVVIEYFFSIIMFL